MEGGQRLIRLASLVATIVIGGALVGCGSGGGGTTTVTTGSQAADVAILGCRGNLQVEPEEVVACAADDGINVDHVKWTGWGEDPAYARGQAIVNTCDPYCAAGNYHLFRVVLIATGFRTCDGEQVYRTIRFAVIEPGPEPPGPGRLQPALDEVCD
jgi:hypothetical protein